MRELMNFDPYTGMSMYFDFDEVTGKTIIQHEQDVEPILERNKRLQNSSDYKKEGIKREWQHVAHIPDIAIMKWRQEGIDAFNKNHMPAIMRKLRDPEWRHLRTTLGEI